MTSIITPPPPPTKGLLKKFGKKIQEYVGQFNPALPAQRLKDTLQSKGLLKKYYDEVQKSIDEEQRKVERKGKEFDENKGSAWRSTKAAAKSTWNKLLKPPLQNIGSSMASTFSGMAEQIPVADSMIEGLEKRFGLKIKKATDTDLYVENPDGTIKINKKFLHDLGPNAIFTFMMKDIGWKGARQVLQIGGTVSTGVSLMAWGPPGMMIGSLLIAMLARNSFKNITIDTFKKTAQVLYSFAVYGFADHGGKRIQLLDQDGEITNEAVETITSVANGGPGIDNPIPLTQDQNDELKTMYSNLRDPRNIENLGKMTDRELDDYIANQSKSQSQQIPTILPDLHGATHATQNQNPENKHQDNLNQSTARTSGTARDNGGK